jgi:uncharacterized protein
MICCCDPRVTEAMAEQGNKVVARLTAFVNTLRSQQFVVGTSETEDAAKLLSSDIGLQSPRTQQALKALFSGCHSDWSRFDEIFNAFWFGKGVKAAVRSNAQLSGAEGANLRDLSTRGDSGNEADELGDLRGSTGDDNRDGADGGVGRMEGASRVENLATTDFRKIHDAEAIESVHMLAERLAKHMHAKLTHRNRMSARGRRIDFRRTIRRSIQSGGTPFSVRRLMRVRKPLRLVVLLDVSGSMSQYTSLFVRFAHGVLAHFREAEAFLIHTSLAHISPALAERDPMRALDRLSLIAQGSGGGTRIGESLATFNTWHAKRVINSRTCVMIVSDGYDTGTPEQLGEEMRRLSKRCRRIVWLNPMIGWEGYTPAARGMQAALPFINLFAPANSLESLAALEPYLSRI